MEAARRDAAARRLRLLIIACAAGFLWALLTVFGQASPSSAAQDDDQGSGLLGLVGGAVGAVGDVTGGVVGAVDDVAQATVKVVEPVVAPVVAVLPAPVKEPVAQLASTAVSTVAATAKAADTLVVSTAQRLTDTVSDVAAGTPLAPVVGSVGTLDPLLPDVGAIGVVDDVVAVVGGTTPAPGETVFPGEPLAPGAPVAPAILNPTLVPAPSVAPDLLAAAPRALGAVAQTLQVAQASALESLRLALVAPFTGGTALPGTAGIGGSLAVAAGLLAALMAAWPRIPLLVRARAGAGDERLPRRPVFETDHSPD
ncbi:hypothetical protein [Microbacterium sp.]|uniref:hypothetical protein n=1 Tax=Microbacterium sp. TaxID=51671 RepID=UPI0037C7847E